MNESDSPQNSKNSPDESFSNDDSSKGSSQKTSEGIPSPHVQKKSGFPLFWLVPLIAVAISGYLIYETIQSRGIPIEIIFENAEGIKAGKTALKFEGVKVGQVHAVELSPKLDRVIVKAYLKDSAKELAREGSQFWIVYPKITIEGISGLDTLIAGNYIAVQEGTGKESTKFKGLKNPPPRDPNSPNLFLTLESEMMPQVNIGSPILYNKHQIGSVKKLSLNVDTLKSEVKIMIKERYKSLVRMNSVFADYSGIDLTLDLKGVDLKTDSLTTIAFGGITMGTPNQETNPAPQAENDTRFLLYRSIEEILQKQARLANKTEGEHDYILELVLSDASAVVLEKTELRLKGVAIGNIGEMHVSPDDNKVVAKAFIRRQYKYIAQKGTRFTLITPSIEVEDFRRVKLDPKFLLGTYIKVEVGTHNTEYQERFHVRIPDNHLFQPMVGLKLNLQAARLGKLSKGAPVYYRGIQVGQIEGYQLARDASSVDIEVVIQKQYASLIRSQTRFWNVSGIDAQISLWGGVEVKTESFTGVFEGAIAFATPDHQNMGSKVQDGKSFVLHEKPEKKWLLWKPTIPLK